MVKRSITRLYRQAVRTATASIREVAQDAGSPLPTVEVYLYQRRPSRAAALKLAAGLERRAVRLEALARALQEAAGEAPRGAPARARR